MRSMKVIILLLFCYACLSTGNVSVKFVSRNFYNILHWDPVEPAFPGEKVLYTVWYWSDAVGGVQFHVKEECQNITALSCDLTAETPSLFDVYYQAKVKNNSGHVCGSTLRFKPSSDTILGAPILSTHTTVSSLHVNVTLPLGPKGDSIADIFARSKKGPHKTEIVYTLKITQPEWAVQTNRTTTGQFVINLKNNQTKYCGYVVYKPSSGWDRRETESEMAPFCVTLPDDPLKLLPWLLVSAALLTAMITMSIVCMCNYAKGGKGTSMPDILVTTFSTPTRVVQYPDRSCIISKPEIYVQTDQTVYATIRMKPNMPPVGSGGYFSQDIPWQDSTGSSVSTGACSPTPNPENTSAQSSEIYSVAVHVPAEQDEDFQQATSEDSGTSNLPLAQSGESWNNSGTSPKLTSHGVPPLPDRGPCESSPARPLGCVLLHTTRDLNGQLLLPSLALQLQSSTDATASPLNSERKPLLSDIIDSNKEGPSLASLQSFDGSEWSDSGCDDSFVHTPTQPYCNSHYSPTQPFSPYLQQECQNTPCSDSIFESGYKQNWITANTLGNAPKDSYVHRRTNYALTWTAPKKEEEDEDSGGEEKPMQILLGGWGLQVQE